MTQVFAQAATTARPRVVSPSQAARARVELQDRIAAAHVPRARADNLRLATWNIRELGKTPRLDASIGILARVIAGFELVCWRVGGDFAGDGAVGGAVELGGFGPFAGLGGALLGRWASHGTCDTTSPTQHELLWPPPRPGGRRSRSRAPATTMTTPALPGRIHRVLGPIVDVAFANGQSLPAVHHVLRVSPATASPDGTTVLLEVTEHLGRSIVRTVALHATDGLARGVLVIDTCAPLQVPAAPACLGRIVDAVGEPLDGLGPIAKRPALGEASAANRWRVPRPMPELLVTGVKAIDLLAPWPRGGKLGVVGGAGTGKSTLAIEMVNNVARAHGGVFCFAGVGDHGARLEDLVAEMASSRQENGEPVLSAAVFVVAGADAAPGARARVVHTATSIVEQLRDEEHTSVFFVVDDVSRAAQARAEIATMSGRGGDAFGYPAALAAEVAALQERLVSTPDAFVTSIQTLHAPADDPNDPAIASALGHFDACVVLSRDLAAAGLFPAIDPLASTSTVLTPDLVGERHYLCAQRVRAMLAGYRALLGRAGVPGAAGWDDEERLLGGALAPAAQRHGRAHRRAAFSGASRGDRSDRLRGASRPG